jgi:uncharacterized membrane protein required for colicin V production
MSDTTIINIVLLGVMAIGAIAGATKGLARQVIELVGLEESFIVAAVIASWLPAKLSGLMSIPHTPELVIEYLAEIRDEGALGNKPT